MSNVRTIFWLLVCTALAVAANFMARYCGPSPKVFSGGAAIDSSLTPSRVVIERRGEPRTVLVRTDQWRLIEPYAANVDDSAVLRLADALLFATVDDALTDAELLKLGRTRRDFGLEQPALAVSLADGESSVTFGFGRSTPSSNGVYVAISGSDAVFVMPASVRAAADLRSAAFRQREIFPFGPESVTAFDVKRSAGSVIAFARKGENWECGGTPASASLVREFLAQLSAARAQDFIWPVGATNEAESVTASLLSGYGLDPESAATVVFKCTDGVDRRISFGNAAGEGLAYALIQNGGAIVTVPNALKEAVLKDPSLFTDLRLFPFDAASVKSFTIADGDVGYVVARGENGTWRLDAPVVASADAETAEAILSRILALSGADVESDGLKVSVTTNAEPVSVSAGKLLGQLRLEDLRSKDVLKIDPALVRRIVSTPDKKNEDVRPAAIVFSRERNAWNVESSDRTGTVSADGVARVLAAINPLRAERIVALKASATDLARYGLDAPYLTVAIDQDKEGSVRRNVLVGARTSGGRFATVGSAEAIFVISRATVNKLMSDLIED